MSRPSLRIASLSLFVSLALALGAAPGLAEAASRSALTLTSATTKNAQLTRTAISSRLVAEPVATSMTLERPEEYEPVIVPCSQTGPNYSGYLCGPDTGGSLNVGSGGSTGAGSGSTPDAEPDPYAGTKAYDHFAPINGGLDLVRSYLLAAASMLIYRPLDESVSDEEFGDYFEDLMGEYGLEASFIESPTTDTQSAILWNDDIVIVSFRGTASNMDRWSDLQNWYRRTPDSWDNVYVHDGFYGAWESVRPMILAEVQQHLVAGKELWLTGHSLGGAIATLAAYEFRHALDIDVAGVHTFGSPRVAPGSFRDEYTDDGLAAITRRWQIEGDPIPSYVPIGTFINCGFFGCFGSVHTNIHVGITTDILVSGPSPDFDYALDASAPDNVLGWHAFGAMVEHVKYDDALMQWLEEDEDPALVELMPALPMDVPPSD